MNIVLILSEDRSICESIRAVLPNSDLALFEHTLEEGMRRLVSTAADVIVLDDSAEFGLNALNALCTLVPGVPILVLTAKVGNDIEASYALAGAHACIPKPFDCDVLIRHIDSCVGHSAMPTQPLRTSQRSETHDASTTQHEQALRWMSRNTIYLDDSNRLLMSLLDASIDIFGPSRVGILMRSSDGIRIVHSQGISQGVVESMLFSFSRGLMRRLAVQPSLIDRAQTGLEDDSLKELVALGGMIALPLVSHGHTCGALVLGEKASGVDYTHSERSLLTTMVSCTSTCLEHSQKHLDITVQQERLNAVLSGITAGVVTVGADRTVTMMNESAARILQLRAVDILGNGIIKLGSAFADIVLRTMKEEQPRIRQVIHDVSIKANLGLTATPIGNEGVVVIFSKIPTAEESSDEDISYSPLWEYLATRVAQEIKNPMVPINTYAQLLPTKYDSEEFRVEFSDIVQESVNRINKVVESIYEFARHPRLNKHSSDINVAIMHVLDKYKDTFARQEIRIETALSKSTLEVQFDPQLFDRAVDNVVQNSIEAMPDGGTLKVKTLSNRGSCSFSIEDSGSGVDEKDASLVFMPFFSTKENGMGLGLTMAERIIKEHDGHLELDREFTQGGRFVFHLPSATSAN